MKQVAKELFLKLFSFLWYHTKSSPMKDKNINRVWLKTAQYYKTSFFIQSSPPMENYLPFLWWLTIASLNRHTAYIQISWYNYWWKNRWKELLLLFFFFNGQELMTLNECKILFEFTSSWFFLLAYSIKVTSLCLLMIGDIISCSLVWLYVSFK